MSASRSITIVGGGLAGLALGIGLRRQGIPAEVIEAGHYPRHRVCGEFLCGRGVEILDRLVLRDAVARAGAVEARTAIIFASQAHSPVRQLELTALCVPRFVLDELLAEEFRRLGGGLRLDERWREGFGEGVVRATGRRPQGLEDGWRWFGVKAHARGISLDADLEMHLCSGGYVGLCRLSGEEVNVCGLFRRRPTAKGMPSGELAWLQGSPGSVLYKRLAKAEFVAGSRCAVAGLCLAPHRAANQVDCCIGDSITMIPPVTGNGMSMALESAALAVGPLAAYSRGETNWSQARQRIADVCDAQFSRRLAWAKVLQWLMLAPTLQWTLGAAALNSNWLWRLMFLKTR